MRLLLITRSYADANCVKNILAWDKMGYKLLVELNPLSAPDKIRLIRPDAIILFGSLGGADLVFFVDNLQKMKMPMNIIVLPNNQQWQEEKRPETITVAGSIKIYFFSQLSGEQIARRLERLTVPDMDVVEIKQHLERNGSFCMEKGCLLLCSKTGSWSIADVGSFFAEEVNRRMEIVEDNQTYTVVLTSYENALRIKKQVWEKEVLFYCTVLIKTNDFEKAYERLLYLWEKRYYLDKNKLFEIDIDIPAAVVAFPIVYIKGFQEFFFPALNFERESSLNMLAFFLYEIVQPTLNDGIVIITKILLQMFYRNLGGDEQICSNFFKVIGAGKFEKDAAEIISAYSSLLSGRNSETSPNVIRAIQYIDSHYSQPLMVGSVADHLGISLSSLSKKFKQQVGCSMIKYLLTFRVVVSALEIAQTKESIASISEKNGFSDAKYFSRVFKSVIGITPSELRGIK